MVCFFYVFFVNKKLDNVVFVSVSAPSSGQNVVLQTLTLNRFNGNKLQKNFI